MDDGDEFPKMGGQKCAVENIYKGKIINRMRIPGKS
jgi:hypothetical protein